MVRSCSAYDCTERASKKSALSFHQFPTDPDLRKQWILATRRENFTPSKSTLLCSKHFLESDFLISVGRKRLHKGAVPSIFDFPKHLVKQPTLPRQSKRKRFISIEELSTSRDLALPSSPQLIQKLNPVRKKRLGDFKEEDLSSPRKVKLMWQIALGTVKQKNQKIKFLLNKTRRLQKRVVTLKNLLVHLKQTKNISQDCYELLEESIPKAQKEILVRQLKMTKSKTFPPELRCFALTLNFYSNSAYNYVRKTFGKCLPHPSTLRKWYTSVDSAPGFTAQSINAIKHKVVDLKLQNKQLVLGLIIDEMSIRKHVHWNGKRYQGYVDLGTQIESDSLPLAKQALVFLLVGLNTRWKIPVAYFLIDGLAAVERANLIRNCLRVVHDCDAKVVSLTFDGTTTNFATATALGAKLKYPNIEPWFTHPLCDQRVHVFLDVCHMLKLIRNTIGDWKYLRDTTGGIISWDYFNKIVEFQQKAGLHAANKLKQRHLNFHREIMKVNLAVQVFSNSVADTLDYFEKDLELDAFKNAQHTAKFCRTLNNVFDALNSRNFLCKHDWGKPFSLDNEKKLKQFFNDAIEYISSLSILDGTNILFSRRKTGFLGLIISIKSIMNFFDDFVKNNGILKFILTYKLSQDHLEMLFATIRSRGGFNNNPTAMQFEAAYKRLLIHNEVGSSETANCVAQDATGILTVSSASMRNVDSILLADLNENAFEVEDFVFTENTSEYISDVIEYIAGFVAKKVAKKLACSICCNPLFSEESTSLLLRRKDRGGLCKASSDVIKICRIAEKVYRGRGGNQKKIDELILFALRQIDASTYFSSIREHILEQDPLDNHLLQLINIILKVYITIRVHYVNKCLTEEAVRIRQQYTKRILFQNQ